MDGNVNFKPTITPTSKNENNYKSRDHHVTSNHSPTRLQHQPTTSTHTPPRHQTQPIILTRISRAESAFYRDLKALSPSQFLQAIMSRSRHARAPTTNIQENDQATPLLVRF